MAYREVCFRIRTEAYVSERSSDADKAAFREESRRLFQELGWTLEPGCNGVCDTVTKDQQDLYLHPSVFSGVMEEANIPPLQEQLSKARTFHSFGFDCHEEYRHDVTTGTDGTATIQVDPGTYRVTEKDVPEPYCLPEDEADRVQTVSLNPNDNKTLTFKNSKKPLLTISKTDADTGKVVPGTVFEVKGIDNDYQDDWTTGADGKVAKRVNPGTYRVTEKHVPAPYYLPDTGRGNAFGSMRLL